MRTGSMPWKLSETRSNRIMFRVFFWLFADSQIRRRPQHLRVLGYLRGQALLRKSQITRRSCSSGERYEFTPIYIQFALLPLVTADVDLP